MLDRMRDNGLPLKLVFLVEHLEIGKRHAGVRKGRGNLRAGLAVPHARAHERTIECARMRHPVIAERAALPHAMLRQLVVVAREERRLPMAHHRQGTHDTASWRGSIANRFAAGHCAARPRRVLRSTRRFPNTRIHKDNGGVCTDDVLV